MKDYKYNNVKVCALAAFFAVSLLSSCGDNGDSSDYDDIFANRFNQEMKWNPDSLAFMSANWKRETFLEIVNTRQASKIKMWGTNQTVTIATYSKDVLLTSVKEGNATTSGIGQEDEAVMALAFTSTDASAIVGINDESEDIVVDILPAEKAKADNYTQMVNAGPLLVYEGNIQSIASTGDNDNKMARSILGVDRKGNIMMAVIDGNIPGYAEGVTAAQAAKIAELSGMFNAVCISSGDASALWNRERGVMSYPGSNKQFDHEGETTVKAVITAKTIQLFPIGDGSEANPFIISSAKQMKSIYTTMSQSDEAVYFEMSKDVDMAGIEWEPFNANAPYKNKIHFDGKGHTISHLTCTDTAYPSFAGVVNGVIKNVCFIDADITSNDSHTGIVGGYLGTGGIFGEIENVCVTGKVQQNSNSHFAGGLAGNFRYGSVKNCYVDVKVTAKTNGDFGVGGIIGYQYDGMNLKEATDVVNTLLENCYFCGSVEAPTAVGGILGKSENRYGDYLRGCINDAVSLNGAVNNVGMIMGRCYDGYLEKGCVARNYSSKRTVTMYSGSAFTPAPNNVGQESDSHHGIITSDNLCNIAKTIGWSENVWSLDGDTPKLKIMK